MPRRCFLFITAAALMGFVGPVAAQSTPPPSGALRAPIPAPGATQFSTQPQARARCPDDTVVWVNTATHLYYFAGTQDYGKGTPGAYMCEKDAKASGARAADTGGHR